uniref:Odorranain-A-HN2 antimicrobial peptide n=1 Tax=Odorrana hainanensis TaxID=431935 RepID=E7EKD7_ODOHA|nr:odorranain-A-HN2 antimicrobial peptide precursor [Odorrana hainanensis]
MFTLKKSLLLLFFLGTINLSLCEQERDADEEGSEENGVEAKVKDIKRRLFKCYKPDSRGFRVCE